MILPYHNYSEDFANALDASESYYINEADDESKLDDAVGEHDEAKEHHAKGEHAKRANGQYFTANNPFNNLGFSKWAKRCDLANTKVLEPFAGSNNLIKMLNLKNYASYDINPQNQEVLLQNTLQNFPVGFDVCVTNPPYLARNSAKRRGLEYPDTEFDDLYKYALKKCLDNCKYVAAIIPASFLQAKIFRERLSCYILLSAKMFDDTEHPVCLSLFEDVPPAHKGLKKQVEIYENQEFIGNLQQLESKIPDARYNGAIRFNDREGILGLIAIDNAIEPSIRFCRGEEIPAAKIAVSSRSITRISIDKKINLEDLINRLNYKLCNFRKETHDIFLTPFKGLRRDNKYRRRLDYALARKFISNMF